MKVTLAISLVLFLILTSVLNWLWGSKQTDERGRALYREVKLRIESWWVMVAVFLAVWLCGFYATLALFFCISLLSLREYITLLETKRADHRALVWSFLIVTPVQYFLIAQHWYGLFSIFIPVYAFLIVTIRVALSGECADFLNRVATIHWGLMTCVFLVSHAPAILTLSISGYETRQDELLFFLIVLTQLSDVFQFVCGKCFGKQRIAPTVSPNKTIEGLIGGMLLTGVVGMMLSGLTPLSPHQDFMLGVALCLFGFCGGLTMSAVKRDKGCKDFGTLLKGHGGILDRIDSVCFTAPLLFHYMRYFYTS
jgi:phosphatidate cytidylyltransferase